MDNINIIDKVVIYSMNKREKTFDSKPIKNAQMDYFISYLPSNRYLSNDRRLLEPKTLVLFQYDAHIIASGVLIKKEKIVDEKYKYASYFEPISITIFQIPITAEDMWGVSRKFVQFSNRQWVMCWFESIRDTPLRIIQSLYRKTEYSSSKIEEEYSVLAIWTFSVASIKRTGVFNITHYLFWKYKFAALFSKYKIATRQSYE